MTDARAPLTVHDLSDCKANGRRIVTLTCYDAAVRAAARRKRRGYPAGRGFGEPGARGAETARSRRRSEQMIYHTKSVRRGSERALVICDMPFLTYQVSREEAIRNCGRVLAGDRLPRRQGRGWPADRGYGASARRRRHSGHGTSGSHAAVGACAGRVSRAGQGRAVRGTAARRRESAGGCGRVRDRAGADARAARVAHHASRSPSPRSASAPDRPATARC